MFLPLVYWSLNAAAYLLPDARNEIREETFYNVVLCVLPIDELGHDIVDHVAEMLPS